MVQRRDYRQEDGTMATWKKQWPEGMPAGHSSMAFPRVGGAYTEGGNKEEELCPEGRGTCLQWEVHSQ